jgi:hypothetical protein
MYNDDNGRKISNIYSKFIQNQVDYLDKMPYMEMSVGKMRQDNIKGKGMYEDIKESLEDKIESPADKIEYKKESNKTKKPVKISKSEKTKNKKLLSEKNRIKDLLGGVKYEPVIEDNKDNKVKKTNSKAKSRGALVSKLMKEKGLSLGQASKYITENNLKY